ncbi:hypothetical protein FJY90_01120 [Candidatus Gottesmanbacteria bacterium]|nr:hypothetical protein [Candidatus Gottesmanbacteria bacterium]
MEENLLPAQPVMETEPKQARPWLKIALFSFLGVLLAAGLVFAALKIGVPTKPRERACSTEAKICPDGSAVGRTGPNCEFAPCPTQVVQNETANWKTYMSESYSYQFAYPPTWVLIGPERVSGVTTPSSVSSVRENLDIYPLHNFSVRSYPGFMERGIEGSGGLEIWEMGEGTSNYNSKNSKQSEYRTLGRSYEIY